MPSPCPLIVLGALLALASAAEAQTTRGAAPLRGPAAVLDLRTREGLAAVGAEWRYRDAAIVQVAHRAPGPDLRPSGPVNRTHDITPRAGTAEFDDSGWEVLDPAALEARRSGGKLSFGWYRLRFSVPRRIGGLDPTGATIVFETVVDDYAEVWVDGRLPQVLGQVGGQLIGGWNAPSRVVVTRDARPGERFTIAVFAANGPLSAPPDNYVWIRSATLEVYPADRAVTTEPVKGEIVRLDPALDAIVPRDAAIERIATGFRFTEGPVWIGAGGHLLFSDPNDNTIYRWTPDGQVSVFRAKSGYSGPDIGEYRQPGSNGLTVDREGRLTINEHGNRRVTRLERNGRLTVLADRYRGRRLNSPNDLVYRSDGSLYFTDPPFGLPRVFDDRRKELPFSGVYRWSDGRLQLLTSELSGPNGLAFSPDERFLYVTNWDPDRKIIMRYEVRPDGTLGAGRVFVDATADRSEQAWDGVKVDRQGTVYAAGPEGVWIVSPAGRRLGTIRLPELAANLAWGDEDGRTLYITARASVYRVRLLVPGVRP